ncbi:MAG: Na+/H+ antiporter NhaC [Symbiopectobacterium sp.]|uniref:Na+/H+ antiporter NhaC n=1 Tax=Symbiopectobacterium sp. TaxID=2952789 RepID=UPI0039E86B4B
MNAKKDLNLGLALLPIIAMIVLLVISYGQLKLPIESLLLVSASVSAAVAYWQGYRWIDIMNAIVNKLAKAMPVILILICVGGMISSWMLSGTIPYMVYWGLKLVSPQYIVITSFLITCATSVCTGTSWGTAGTVGVALMGVAAGPDVSLAATAGAVVSGAYFGDKLSPLSDSTNFAAIVAETDLYSHIRHLMYTTLPSFGLAAAVYLCFGYTTPSSHAANLGKVNQFVTSIENLYHFNMLLLLPPILVLGGAMTKLSVIPLMLAASVLAIDLGIILQGFTLQQGFISLIHGFNMSMFTAQGTDVAGLLDDIPRLLDRGGMFSIMSTILLVLCTFSFAGALTLTGALTVIINRLLKMIKGVGQLIAATVATTLLVTGATSDGKLALLIPAELFRESYQRMELDNKNLSRTVEDAGTVTEPLLPWTSAGVYMASTLGVSTLDFVPWAIQCYAAIIFALIYGFTGFGIARLPSTTTQANP